MGKRSSSSSSNSSRDSEARRRRKREKRERREQRKLEKREKREKTVRRSPSPVGKTIVRSNNNSKLQDASAEIEAALNATPIDELRPVLANAAVYDFHPPEPMPTLVAPGEQGNEVPSDKLRIYVGNINYAASEADVRNAFSRFGTLRGVTMRVDPDKGHHRGFAFVEFAEPQSVEMVYRMPPRGICFGGMPVRIDRPTTAGSGPQPSGGAGGSASAVAPGGAPCPIPPFDIPVGPAPSQRNALAQQIAAARGLVTNSSLATNASLGTALNATQSFPIFIENLVRTAAEVDDTLTDEIRHECAKFGPVLHIEFYMAEGSHAPAAAVEFGNVDSARQCVARMNGRIFDGRPLRSGLLTREFYDKIRQ